MNDGAGRIERPSDRMMRTMMGICTFVITISALYLTRAIFAPLAFAVLIIAVLWPIQGRLQTMVPKLVALAVSILVTILIFVAFGSMVAWGFSRIAHYVADDVARIQTLYAQLAVWLEGHDIVLAGLWAEHFNVGWILRAIQEITTRLNSTLSFTVVVLIYVILGLLEVDDAASRLRALKNVEAGRILLAGCLATAAKFRRYMVVRTMMSVVTGLLVWAFASVIGLRLAAEWGVIAFALNYIPFIGSLVATLGPTFFAVAQFESWQMPVVVFGCLNVIQFVVGSYLEPQILGGALSVSPFLSLFAVFFWTFLWGIPGAFIGVPIVIAALTFCEQHESTSWVADLLGSAKTKRA